MSSIGEEDIKTTRFDVDIFDDRVRGILDGYSWSDYAISVFSFSIPDSVEDYEDSREGLIESYPDNNHEGVEAMPDDMVRIIFRAAAEFNKALTFQFRYDKSDEDASRLRYGYTDFTTDESDGLRYYGYSPDREADSQFELDKRNWMSGDMFFDKDGFDGAPKGYGSSAYYDVLVATGQAMGLKLGSAEKIDESYEDIIHPALDRSLDAQEFSVMSSRSFVGDTGAVGHFQREGHYAQTLMQLDYLALQTLYGADFTTQKSDTTYSWNEKTGQYLIDGKSQWTPDANVVFMTIWDGGGTDTYDLTNYDDGVEVDLRPGGRLNFGRQLAELDVVGDRVEVYASGNVYNALQYRNSLASLIENVKTGDGDDDATGNAVGNLIETAAGDDTLKGGDGDDSLAGGAGADDIDGGKGRDIAVYVSNAGLDLTISRVGAPKLGAWDAQGSSEAGNDLLKGIEGFAFGDGADGIRVVGAAAVDLYGQGGNDTIEGAGAGFTIGGRGTDTLVVGDVPFKVYGGDITSEGASLGSRSQNDVLVIDRSGDAGGYFLGEDDRLGFGVFYDFDDSVAYGISRVRFTGGAGDDAIDGGVGDDRIVAGGGRNLFQGRSGDDTASGGGAGDTFYGDAGNDSLSGGAGADYLLGGLGDDTLDGGGGSDRLYGEDGDDLIRTGEGADGETFGGDGNDTLVGSADRETLNGGVGDDRLDGQGGEDDLSGDAGNDTLDAGGGVFDVDGGTGVDRLIVDRTGETKGVAFALGGSFGSDDSRAVAMETMEFTAGSGADTLTGGERADLIRGGAGADRLIGGAGNDTLGGGSGNDTVTGGDGFDRFELEKGFGVDVASDFDADRIGGQDVIDVRAFGFANFSAFKAAVTIAGANNAVLTFANGGGQLTLTGVGAGALGADDFLF
jgi:serralysin